MVRKKKTKKKVSKQAVKTKAYVAKKYPSTTKKVSHAKQLFKLVFLVVITGVLLIWLNQRSLTKVWGVVYHQPPPSWLISEKNIWKYGDDLYVSISKSFQALNQLDNLGKQFTTSSDIPSKNYIEKSSLAFKSHYNDYYLQHLFYLSGKQRYIFPLQENLYDRLSQPVISAPKPKLAELNSLSKIPPKPTELNTSSKITPEPAELNASSKITPEPTELKKTPSKISLNADDVVFFVGDSMMQGIAPHIKKQLYQKYRIDSIDLSEQSSGLTYPSLVDWPQTIKYTLERNPKIKVMVIFLGPNDPWDMPPDDGGKYLKYQSEDWESQYRQRIEMIISEAEKYKIDVIWVSPPNMRKKSLSRAMAYLREIYKTEAEKYGVYYLSVNDIFKYQENIYSDYMGDGSNRRKLRTGDGTHFSVTGQKLIAQAIMQLLDFNANPKKEADHE